MTQLNRLLNQARKIISYLDNRVFYIVLILLLAYFLYESHATKRDLEKQVSSYGVTIDDLKFKNTQLKLSDSTKALKIRGLEVQNSEQLKKLNDSLTKVLVEKGKLQRELGLIKYNSTFKPPKLPTVNVDSLTQAITDSLKNLPCDSLKKLADSNLLYIPARFEDSTSKYYVFKGKIIRKDGKVGIDFDSTYPRIYSKPTIVFGESRKWFLGKWRTTAIIGDENPYIEISDGRYIQVKNKERKFGVTVGYGATYNIKNNTFNHGPTIVFGLRF